ncbi:hypothetical protein KGM_213325 [Danaus plexippus plexippus]|uniref:Uncharacterized protein n=1 Tax=Danaus plexippus plexippus TaxID=278856 RepID=A0A212F5Y8_DANPL|nr:hypothetical protein KGM_213325 [Danaus plexippus plexippus]
MLSTEDLERLITTKRREIEQEKIQLGLSEHNDVDNKTCVGEEEKKVEFRQRALSESNAIQNTNKNEDIPPDLERYIRVSIIFIYIYIYIF